MIKVTAFSAQDLRVAERVMKVLIANDISPAMLFDHNKAHEDSRRDFEHNGGKKHRRGEGPKPNTRRGSGPKRSGRRGEPKLLMAPGETEISELMCECGENVLIEGICGGTMARLGVVRRVICTGCNKEFKVR